VIAVLLVVVGHKVIQGVQKVDTKAISFKKKVLLTKSSEKNSLTHKRKGHPRTGHEGSEME